jgi:RNA polymerase sigma factor (sigma-70 family)
LVRDSEVRRGRIDRPRADTAFARLYEDHVWRVYGFLAYRLGRDRETIEDLTQLTFERALRAWPRFDPQRSSVSTWLLAIAGNALIDHYRRGARVFEELDELALPRVGGPEERFAGSPELVAALGRLAEREREVLALRYGGDLTGPEIAELLGLSLANVQQINSRGLRRLRQLLGERPDAGHS